MERSRRQVLAGAAAAIGAGTAGCLGGDGDGGSPSGDGAQASFYLLYDLARQVAGEDMAVDSIVPFGQHGHGWDGPTGQQQREIYTARVFFYMGDGFQPWADEVVANVESDDEDVAVVNAREGIDLLRRGGDHDEAEGDGEHEDEAGNDHDPHFWLDPLRTREAVENVRDGFLEVDPDREDGYRERAGDYLDDLQALHESFNEALSDPAQEHVLVAGHNSFGYLAERYGFEVHALTGISPDERPSASTRAEAEGIVEEYGIDYVLAPALESKRAAEQLVEETDAEEVLEITAIAGVRDEWDERGWGYLELMENVNLPSLTKALQGE